MRKIKQFHDPETGRLPLVPWSEFPVDFSSDGGVFAFGDPNFYGSMGNKRLNKSIVGIG
jgi:hypothetical protein